jgi:hypothetical protein
MDTEDSKNFKGPKTNTVEKLAELRKAGVNIGMSIDFLTPHLLSIVWRCQGTNRILNYGLGCSAHELLSWFIRIPPERHRQHTQGRRVCVPFPFIFPLALLAGTNAHIIRSVDPTGRPVAIALDTVSTFLSHRSLRLRRQNSSLFAHPV